MATLRMADVWFAYRDDQPILVDTTLHLEPGWAGLVGANGAGKTTLLDVLCGALVPEAGAVVVEPADALIWRCRQDVAQIDEAIEELAWSWSALAMYWKSRLTLEVDELMRWSTLSPGQRKRWQVAGALAREPDILLLDEPSNHLDAPSRALLVEALREFGGVGVIVSHDRSLLDALCTRTLRLRPGGRLEAWRGPYSEAKRQWEREARHELDRLETAARRERAMAKRLHEAQAREAAAASSNRTARRISGPRDSDARSMAAKKRAADGLARASHQRKLVRAEHARLSQARQGLGVERERGRALELHASAAAKAHVISLECDGLYAGERELLAGPLSLSLGRHDRVEVAGANGVGKSTLIGAMLEACRLAPDDVLVLPQELDPGAVDEALGALRAMSGEALGEVMEIVAALGLDPTRLLSTRSPSPGEARKAMLALGLSRRVSLLVLDEPTNHLDLPSIERLEEVLSSFDGALLLVTHDQHLAAQCTEEVWLMASGSLEKESRSARVAR